MEKPRFEREIRVDPSLELTLERTAIAVVGVGVSFLMGLGSRVSAYS